MNPQTFPGTPSVTSRYGTVHENRPVRLDNILRFLCDVSVWIGDKDCNQYPAIQFDLANTEKAVQYWVYPNEGLRDADCAMLTAATAIPESDYLAYWDVTGDGLPDLDPDAIFIGGASGTHEGDQLYFDQTGVPNVLPAPFDGIIQVRRLGLPYFLADFDAGNGQSLATAGNWSGPFAVDVAANMVGTIGHTNLMQFAKLSFALTLGQINSKAAPIQMTIKTRKGGLLSGNTGNVLTLGVNIRVGNLFGAEDFQFVGKKIYLPQFINAVPADQGVIVIGFDDNKWSQNSFRTQVANDKGVNGRVIDYSPAGGKKALIWSGFDGAPTAGKSLYLTPITGFDVDGFPNWGTSIYVQGEGSGAAGTNVPYAHPFLQLNDMPVLLVGRSPQASTTGHIAVNTGTLAAPVYSTWLETDDIDSKLRSIQHVRFDSSGAAYFAHAAPNAPAPTGYGVAKLSYIGQNNNQTDLLDSSNWIYEEIGFRAFAGATPPADGNGQTAAYRGKGIAIDEVNKVNGQPTIWMSDEFGQVVFRITRNLNSFGDGRDWDFTITIGQSGVAGSTEGIGTAALLDRPCGLNIVGNTLYIAEKIGSKIRAVNMTTLQTSTWWGVDGVRSHLDQLSY